MSIDTILVADTETGGFDPETAPLLEVAAVWHPRPSLGNYAYQQFSEYEGVIPPEAKAVHHIQESDVAPGAPNCSPRAAVIEKLLSFETDTSAWCFHNAAFDRGFLPELRRPVLCTWRCSLHLWPEAPSHKNMALMYWLGTEPDRRLTAGLESHRALFDAAVTASILGRMLETHTADQLLELSTKPILLDTVRFGKYKGEKWTTLVRDSGYVAWMRRSGNWDDDVDVMYTLDVLQGRRDAA